MIDFTSVLIQQMALHRVGNKHREESNFISESLADLDEDMEDVLIRYFLKPFTQATENFHFVHSVDLSYNEIFGLSSDVFQNSENLLEASKKITQHLFEQSNHPHIKAGDVFVVYFKDLFYQEHTREAIGIFKSENKTSFLKMLSNESNLALTRDSGISLSKLDKACLIIDEKKEDGYRVLSLDNNNYDAAYWKENFLGVDFIQDNNYNTKQYVEMVKGFAEEVIADQATRKDQIDFLNVSVNYLENQETVNVENFKDDIFADPVQKNAFTEYQRHYENTNHVEIADQFDLAPDILQKQKRKIKDSIKLDTNIQIKLDFNNPDSSQQFIEQGYDAEKGMNYYKVYFNREVG
jgi:hypothetical protein